MIFDKNFSRRFQRCPEAIFVFSNEFFGGNSCPRGQRRRKVTQKCQKIGLTVLQSFIENLLAESNLCKKTLS